MQPNGANVNGLSCCQTGDVTFAFATRSEDRILALIQGSCVVNVLWTGLFAGQWVFQTF